MFQRNGISFGWEDIEAMKEREDQRVAAGLVRFVPGLLSSYIERDCWTKLNVKPSKIFQQDAVLSELLSHGNAISGDNSCLQVYRYLLAVNKMFERGLLSKYPVHNVNSPIITGVMDGYQYFVDWFTEGRASSDKTHF